MGTNVPKQFLNLNGKSILLRTLEVFSSCNFINEIIVVANPQYLDVYNETISLLKSDIIKVVCGDCDRQKSVFNGINSLNIKCEIVVVHDAVRPFVSVENINDTINGAMIFDGVTMGVNVKDTIKISNDNTEIVETLDRENLWSIQTPQAFKYKSILDAHKRAVEDDYLGTDDCSLLERLGYSTKIIKGNYNNIKITTIEDMSLAEIILTNKLD
jgi:2-C-methyl-D-erythritol 4-phosphate cytidylyltransferase